MIHSKMMLLVVGLIISTRSSPDAHAQERIEPLLSLTKSETRPFVLVESSGEQATERAQGVFISPNGYVLSVGHIAWVGADSAFTERFLVKMRGATNSGLPGHHHKHTTYFGDREDTPFYEWSYRANLLRNGKSRFVRGDLSVFRVTGTGKTPSMAFYSSKKPQLEIGETLHLCHFFDPHAEADPTFLISPLRIVGVAQTTSGLQYLAEGYYRVGSSGGAILKDGKLIGIQSAGYTINTKDNREHPHGLISFELVWGDLFKDIINSNAPDTPDSSMSPPRANEPGQ